MTDSTSDELVATTVRVAQRLSRVFDLQQVMEEIVDSGRSVLAADRASVLLYDDERHELYAEATSTREVLRFAAGTGIAGETLAAGRPIRIDDCATDQRFDPEIDRRTGYQTKSLLSVPLIGAEGRIVGVMQVLNAERGHFVAGDERRAEVFAGLAALAIERARDVEARLRQAKMEHDLSLAREIQMNLLPRSVPDCPGYDIAVFFRSAEETGGDIYDLLPLAGGRGGDGSPLMILLADATGHGIDAALSVTQVRAMLRIAARLDSPLDLLCRVLNEQLTDDLPDNRFVTAFVGILDPGRHEIDYHCLGQGPLLHVDAESGSPTWYPASSVPMGLFAEAPMPRPAPIAMGRGDLFVLLSDGFYEYANSDDEEMGADRIGEVAATYRIASAEIIVDELCAALGSFAAGAPQHDDLTAIVIKRR